jgi:cholesterol transport system auxiliary component
MNPKIHVAAIIVFVLLAGCLNIKQPSPKVDYYTLEYELPAAKPSPSLPFILKIEPFATSPVYDSNRILYREKEFKRSEYAYHKWRAVPGDLTTAFLARDFAASSLFKAIIQSETVPEYSHLLTGKVEEFYQRSGNDHWEAVLSVNITLSSFMAQHIHDTVLLQKRYAFREKCSQKTPEAFVEAMSRAVQRLSGELIEDVYTKLKE